MDVVLVQGTDVIEETAFAFDLLVASPKPLVVVGAMRSAADPGYEGPANLRDAVRAAASPALAGQGTVVVMGGQILPADDVTKTHTDAYDTFQALNLGPLGRVAGDRVVVARSRLTRRSLGSIPEAAAEPVPLITATVATDGALLRLAAGSGGGGARAASWWRPRGPATRTRTCCWRHRRPWRGASPWCMQRAARQVARRAAMAFRVVAPRGCGPAPCPAASWVGPRRASRWPSASGRGWTTRGLRALLSD